MKQVVIIGILAASIVGINNGKLENWEDFCRPIVSVKPESTQAPAVSEKPEMSNSPEATKSPDNSNPTRTPEPSGTSNPGTLPNTPEATKKPQTSTAPEATKKPQTTAVPETTKKPQTSTAPEATKKPQTTAAPSLPEATKQPETDNNTNLSYAEQVVNLVNAERRKAGLSELTLDKTIELAALTRAKEIQTSFSHTRPNGSGFQTALTEAGVNYRGCGENIAWGQKSPEAVMQGWMNSPGHRANILNKNFTKIGVGYIQNAKGVNYWTQLFTY